ncbi:DMT family transporter [Glaciecola sp. 1036]|uniref:DMT family transporter n=1 Tax=Alteromonadaceae TaxID=72275 RepID=UPI003CFC2FB5
MKLHEVIELFVLGAIWGASFMLMKEAVPEFGIFALVEYRVLGASICLLLLVYLRKQQDHLIRYWPRLLFVGVVNTAIPFCLFNYSAGYLDASLLAILNAAAPMFGVVVAWLYLREKIGIWGILGLGLGFVGVIFISLDPTTSEGAAFVPVMAALGATLCYGICASYIKKHLAGAKPFAVAAGSQMFAAIALLPISLANLPSQIPTANGWMSATLLSILCTGVAYIMYFDLISKIGVTKTMTVGYLVPLFGIMWGVILLDEVLTAQQLLGGVCILTGVMLVTNVVKVILARRRPQQIS